MTFRVNKVRLRGGNENHVGQELGWGMTSPTPHPALQYTLTRDVVSSLRRHRMHEQQFTHPPLLVLNSFGPLGMHVKLMATMFQNLFPSINVHKVGRVWVMAGVGGWCR